MQLYAPKNKPRHQMPGKHTVALQAFFFIKARRCSLMLRVQDLPETLLLGFPSLGWGEALDQVLHERSSY